MFQHHPWFLTSADEPDQYYNLPLARRREYLDLFARSGVTHVFAGHYHRNAFAKDGPLEMVTTGPVGKPMGADSSGVRIVDRRRGRVTHLYYALDSIPGTLPVPRMNDSSRLYPARDHCASSSARSNVGRSTTRPAETNTHVRIRFTESP